MLNLYDIHVSSMETSCSSVVISVNTVWYHFEVFRQRILPFMEALRGVDSIFVHLYVDPLNVSVDWTLNISKKTFIFPRVDDGWRHFMRTLELVQDPDACIVSLDDQTLYRDINTVMYLRNMSVIFPDAAIGLGCEEPLFSSRFAVFLQHVCPYCATIFAKGTNVYYLPWHFVHNTVEVCNGWLAGWLGVLYKRRQFMTLDSAQFLSKGSCALHQDMLASGFLNFHKLQRLVFTKQKVKPVYLYSDARETDAERWQCAQSLGFA